MQDIRSKIKHSFFRLQIFLNANPHIKRFFGLLALVLFLPLIVGAALTVQNLSQKASGSDYVKIVDANGSVLTTTSDPNIFLQIILPPDWTINPSPQSKQIFPKTAYAQGGCVLSELGSTTKCQQTVYDTCDSEYFCAPDGQAHFKCHDDQFPGCAGEYICDPQTQAVCNPKTPTNTPVPTKVQQPTASQNSQLTVSGFSECNNTSSQIVWTWKGGVSYAKLTLFNDTLGKAQDFTPSGDQTTFTSDGLPQNQQFRLRVLDAQGNVGTSEIVTSSICQTTQPSQPQSAGHMLKEITIENKDSDGSSGGDQKRQITSNLQQALSQPIAWRLNALQSDQTQATRVVQVILSDGQNIVTYTTEITLKEVKLTVASAGMSTADLTNQLAQFVSQSPGTQSTDAISQAAKIASLRKKKLLQEMETNPQVFLDHATLFNQYDSFPKEVQPYIEKQISMQGELAVGHGDDFVNKRAIPFYHLITSSELFSLNFAQVPSGLKTGAKVSLQGIALSNSIAIPKTSGSFTVQNLKSSDDIIFGAVRIAVAITKFEDQDSQAYSTETVRDQMFGHTNSVDHYYRTNSYGKISFIGNVFDQIVIPRNNGVCDGDDLTAWINAVDNTLQDRGISINGYYGVVYMLPPTNNCRNAFASIGRPDAERTLINTEPGSSETLHALVHELGHNLGLNHANYLNCIGCQSEEYGDIFDPMGHGGDTGILSHMNAQHKVMLKLYEDFITPVIDDTPHRIKIVPLEKTPPINGSSIENDIVTAQSVRIRTQIDHELYDYYLEYRQSLNYDSSLPESVTKGVLIHIGIPYGVDDTHSYLIPHPNKAIIGTTQDAVLNAALSDGDDVVLPGEVRIEQISHDETGAVVEISKSTDNAETNTQNALKNISGSNSTAENNPQFKLFVQCFKEKANTASCPNKNAVDYNKDGKVDEQDYKLFLQSLEK